MLNVVTFTENYHSKAIFSISWNHITFQFQVVNSYSLPFHIISAISSEITLKMTCFSLKITKNLENCHLRISRFIQMMKSGMTFKLDSRKFVEICRQMKRAILMGRAIDGLIHEPWHPSLLEERISTLKTMTLSWDDEMRKWSFVANNLMSKTRRIGTMYGVGGGASN